MKSKKRLKKVNKNLGGRLWFRKRVKSLEDKWGFIPINWKGWVALILLIGINVFSANYFDVMNVRFGEVSKFLVVFLFSFVVFVLIAKRKTK